MAEGRRIHEENSRTALAEYGQESFKTKTFPQYVAAILATLGAFSAGTCLSWSSPALPILQQWDVKPYITVEQGSWISSIITLGAFCGAIPAGALANLIGRKRTLQLLALPMILSWILISYSGCVYGLYMARFLAGTVVGAYSVAIPMYVAELAEPKIRGSLGTFFQLQITAGILFEYLVGMSGDLKLIALLPVAVPLLFLMTFSFMPESPVHLTSRGQTSEARASLQWFRGASCDVEDELMRIRDQIEEAQNNKASISDFIKTRAVSRALIIALGLMVFQQLSGINAVIFYTETIFKSSASSIPSHIPPIIIGAVMVLATYVSTILIDRAGRRILLIISSAVMAACLASMALYFYLLEMHRLQLPFAVPLLSMVVYMTVFSLGFGPIPWMMLGELFPAKTKGIASSISAAVNWLLAFTVTKLFGNIIYLIGSAYTFGIFSVVCILGTLFVVLTVPETKGKDMDEIQVILAGRQEISKEIRTLNDIIIIDIKK